MDKKTPLNQTQEAQVDALLAARLPAPPAHLETLIINEAEVLFAAPQKPHNKIFNFNLATLSFLNFLNFPRALSGACALALIAAFGTAPLISDILAPDDMFTMVDVVADNILSIN